MRQLFSYYGGKQRIAGRIVELIPKHTVYVEPFFGGGSVFFRKPLPQTGNNNHYREVINDMDSRIITAYRVMQDRAKAKELLRKIYFTPFSAEEYELSNKIMRGQIEADEITLAWAVIFNFSSSFANKACAGLQRGVYGRNHATTWKTKKQTFYKIIDRLDGVYIESKEALDILKKWNSPQSFAYIDPPYPETDCGHYKGYTVDDHKALIKFLDEVWQGSFILSGYDNDYTPEEWKIKEIEVTCSAKGRVGYDRSKKMDESDQKRKRAEVLWYRKNTAPIRDELLKVMRKPEFSVFNEREE